MVYVLHVDESFFGLCSISKLVMSRRYRIFCPFFFLARMLKRVHLGLYTGPGFVIKRCLMARYFSCFLSNLILNHGWNTK